jgi:hypothetical protein
MVLKKRRVEGLTDDSDANLTPSPLNLGAKYGILRTIRAKGWASSAKAATSVDTAVKIRITDNNSDVVYLDASDRDYGTAEVTINPTMDDTATGINVVPTDATGAAATAGAGAPIIMESPVTVAIVNGGTTTDYFTVDLIVEV